MTKPRTLRVQPENIPAELKGIDQWVGWRLHHDGEKWQKTPIDCQNGKRASVTDPTTWSTFAAALAYYHDKSLDGIGFVVRGDGYSGVDLDKCRNPENGTLADWVVPIVENLDSYTEASPSGTGLRIFVQGWIPERGRRNGNVEVYTGKHYFTVTGAHQADTPKTVEDRQPELLALYHEHIAQQESVLPDDELLVRARRAENGPKFSALWDGDRRGYQSKSEADLALCAILGFWTRRDARRVEALFGKSELGKRKKWTRRDDYRQDTIRRALKGLVEFYQPRRVTTSATKTLQDYSSFNNTHGLSPVEVADGTVLALDLAETDSLVMWEMTFRLIRRLLRIRRGPPEVFEPVARLFCEKREYPWDDFWLEFLRMWGKVKKAEGDDSLQWAKNKAEAEPYPHIPCSRPAVYGQIVSLAWHLSQLRRGKPIFLPTTSLALMYKVCAKTISNATFMMKRDGLIVDFDPNYSFVKHKAKEYLFIGKSPPLANGEDSQSDDGSSAE